jgi:hypothetical protein
MKFIHKADRLVSIIMTTHVYVVMEIPSDDSPAIGEARVHGVFANREHAEAKKEKLYSRHKRAGYVAVLKQKIRGA